MKRFRWLALILILFIPLATFAAEDVVTAIGVQTTSGQVTCDNTATVIRAATPGRISITFQAHDNTVYIAPRSDITTSNAGILLNQYSSFTADRTAGDLAWYCIRAGANSAKVGWTEERQ